MANVITVALGNSLDFTVNVINNSPTGGAIGALVDPATLKFAYTPSTGVGTWGAQVSYTWTNPTGDPTAHIVRVPGSATGVFIASLIFTTIGEWYVGYYGTNPTFTQETTVLVSAGLQTIP